MAIAFDTSSQGKATGGSATVTVAHTATGSNLKAVIGIADQNAISGNVTGVTYNGVAATQIGSPTQAGAGAYVYLYMISGIPTGASNVVASRTTTTNAIYLQTLTYTDCAQVSTADSSNGAGGAANVTTRTTTATSVANNIWAAAVCYSDNGGQVAGTNSTGRGTLQDTIFRMYDNSGVAPITPASTSYSMTVNATSGGVGMMMGGFAPFVATANSGFFRAAMM